MFPKPPEFLASRLAAPIAVLGEGVSGRGAEALLGRLGAEAMAYDAKGREFTEEAARRHRLVVFSPGFPPDHPWLVRARAAGGLCLGELDFASLFWRGRIIAVTGTNGKTTTTEFLRHALVGAGRPAVAAGNIGDSFSEVVAACEGGGSGTIAVCEVSSFQAETLAHLRPEATLWTNLAEDHLERHGTMERYFAAKAVLAERSGTVFIGASVEAAARLLRLPSGPSGFSASNVGGGGRFRARAVETENQPADPALRGTVFEDYPQRENYLLVQAWWRWAGFDDAGLLAAARTFQLGRHRLSRVADIGGVTYWNDSKATNFHAVEAAVARFASPVILIAGGRGKGGDIAGFVRRIAPGVRKFVLIGETAAALGRACAALGRPHLYAASLEEAVAGAAAAARPGDNVLLSPAFASFDMFRNYQDRGDQFEELVRARLLAQTPA